MPPKVKFLSLDTGTRDSNGVLMAKVGDRVQVTVSISDRSKSRGGSFKVTHPAFGGDVTCPFQGRYDTGDDKRTFKKRKDRPTNYSGNDEFIYSLAVRSAADPEGIQFTAQTDCEIDGGGTATQFRGVADQTALDLALPVRVVDGRTQRFAMTRSGNSGIASTAINRLQDQVRVFVRLMFLDPEGKERPLPEGMPVRAILGDRDALRLDLTLSGNGFFTISAVGSNDALKHRHITLLLGDDSDNVPRYELPTESEAQSWGPVPTESDATGTRPNRYFTLPKRVDLKLLDCAVSEDDGRWDADTGRIALAKNGRPASLGRYGAPVKIVIKPKWQFVRFAYFDRHYGHSDHGGEAVTMPAVTLEGFRATPTLLTDVPEVQSNWWVDPDSDGKVVQCIPWFRQKTDLGADDPHPGVGSELRFTLPANTFMQSESATVRKRVIATDEQRKPGPERLKFYDLPALWKARNYYGWLSATTGESGWYQDIVTKTSELAKPIVFSLDDIVLTDDAGKMLDTWTHDDRLALFANTFDDTVADCNVEGLFKADAGGKTPWFTEKPATGAPEEAWNYVRAQPKWTRLIAAGGNLFDVFDTRSVEGSPHGGDETVGARAAVRVLDATAAIPGLVVKREKALPPPKYEVAPDGKPEAGRWLVSGRPARIDRGVFSIQAYYDQEYVTRQGVYDVNKGGSTGRIDVALLRCCDVADRTTSGQEKEVAKQIYFLRQHYNYVNAPAAGAADFAVAAHRALLDSWNGITPAYGRATLVPVDNAKRVRVGVLLLHMFLDKALSHFTVDVKTGDGARNNRGGQLGTGLLSDGKHVDPGDAVGFTNGHEHGHERGLPDEYNERWSCASFGQPSFGQHLPGDPYEMDGRGVEYSVPGAPMMNGNRQIQARYFWQSAEWVRRALGFPLKVSFNGFDEFSVPPHADARRNYVFWPLVGLNNQVLAASDPIAANRAKFNLFAYPLGKDRFGLNTLKEREDPSGSTPYDGILMVTVLLKVTVPTSDEASAKSLAQALARVTRRFGARKLNHRWYLTGTAAQGAAHEWTFSRCLIHFSPRLLVSAEDLPTRAQFLAAAAPYEGEAVCVTFANRLDVYHGVPWAPLLAKQNALTVLKASVPEPVLDVRGTWVADSAAIPVPPPPPPPTDGTDPPDPGPPPPPRPVEFTQIDTLVGQYVGFNSGQFGDRSAKLKEIIDACGSYTSSNGGSPYEGAATALADRATRKRSCLEGLIKILRVRRRADTIETDRTKHTETVTNVGNTHGNHFVVTCELDAEAPAAWDIGAPVVEIPKPDDWLNTVHADVRTDARVQTAKSRVEAYTNLAVEDYAARLGALDTLATAAVASPVDVRGDWDTASVQTGKKRPPGFASVDRALTTAESRGTDEHDERATSFAQALRLLDGVIQSSRYESFKTAANALRSRADAARKEALAMKAVRAIEAHATRRKAQLQLEAASRTVTLTAPDADGFEDALLEVFPSMIGVYKPADQITADDLKPLVTLLGLTTPDVKAI